MFPASPPPAADASSYLIGIVFGLLVYLLICGIGGAYCSAERKRPPAEGFWLGVFFGPLGMVAAACLPTVEVKPVAQAQAQARPAAVPPPPRAPTPLPRTCPPDPQAVAVDFWGRSAAQRDALEAERAVRAAEREARKRERMEDRGVKPGPWAWFKVLPDMAQVAIVAVALTAPALLLLFWAVGYLSP